MNEFANAIQFGKDRRTKSSKKGYFLVSLFIVLVALPIALLSCEEPVFASGSNKSDTPTPPPTISEWPEYKRFALPTLVSVRPNGVGGTVIQFTESSYYGFKHTLITATSIGDEGHIVEKEVPLVALHDSIATQTVTLYGLKENKRYSIHLVGVTKDGKTPVSKVTNHILCSKADTGATKVKVFLGHIPSLAGIETIDVLAVNADETYNKLTGDTAKDDRFLDALADDKTKSVLVSKAKPKSDETVILENIQAPKTGSSKGKVQIWYRLHDINGIKPHYWNARAYSQWITLGFSQLCINGR